MISKRIIAEGITQEGETFQFIDASAVFASNQGLKGLRVNKEAICIFCVGNNLKELHVPDNVMTVKCDKDLFNYDECQTRDVQIYYYNPYRQ